MKRLAIAFLLALAAIPAFSLTIEATYLNGSALDGTDGFMAGLMTSNPVFNVSFGLLYDEHDVELKYRSLQYAEHANGDGDIVGGWEYHSRRETKRDMLIGPYIKCDWSILPIEIKKSIRIGTNISLQAAATYSDLTDVDFPVGATASLQTRFKNIDVLLGFQYIYYPRMFNVNDINGKAVYVQGDETGGRCAFPVSVRYNFNPPKYAAPPAPRKHPHIIGGGLQPSL